MFAFKTKHMQEVLEVNKNKELITKAAILGKISLFLSDFDLEEFGPLPDNIDVLMAEAAYSVLKLINTQNAYLSGNGKKP